MQHGGGDYRVVGFASNTLAKIPVSALNGTYGRYSYLTVLTESGVRGGHYRVTAPYQGGSTTPLDNTGLIGTWVDSSGKALVVEVQGGEIRARLPDEVKKDDGTPAWGDVGTKLDFLLDLQGNVTKICQQVGGYSENSSFVVNLEQGTLTAAMDMQYCTQQGELTENYTGFIKKDAVFTKQTIDTTIDTAAQLTATLAGHKQGTS